MKEQNKRKILIITNNMQIYNTLKREKERFKPLRQEQVKVYYCWPTPYNYAHIWNLKTYVVEDIIVRTLRFFGYKIVTTMNITDIDDKTIRDSQIAWEKLLAYTQRFSEVFMQDIQKLNVVKADNIVPISTLVDEMVWMINVLIKRWYAYLGDDGSVYYEIKKFKKYWNLAHLDFSWMKESVRVNNDEYDKENAADFALWKGYKEADWENYWEGEFQFWDEKKILKWRPWWHIECSACNLKYFWAQIDIHMWGVDNIFPHHQNEIAQSEAYSGKEFAKYWIHSGHITVEGKKMSKSANNFYTLRDLEKHFEKIDKSTLYRAIRLSFINWKYRDSVDFSFEKMEQNFNNIKKIDEVIKRLDRTINSWLLEEKRYRRDLREEMQDFIWEYCMYLEDDFNMPEAIRVFNEYISFVNSQIDSSELSIWEAKSLFQLFETYNEVLGIIDFSILNNILEISEEIMQKFEARNEAKASKDFTTADKLRDELLELWFKIVDDRAWSRLEKA